MLYFKIRHKPTGRFWSGGGYGGFVTDGKVWSNKPTVKGLITRLLDHRHYDHTIGGYTTPYNRNDIEIVSYTLTELRTEPA